jgi:hypothetical protein
VTTFVDFVSSQTAPFSFQPTLDGTVYAATVTWNLFAQRYYLNLNALDGTLIFSLPLVGSPVGVALAGLSWAFGTVEATTEAPHGYEEGSTVALTLSGSAPDAYNGRFLCLVTGDATFTYPLAEDPGDTASLGVVNFNVNLLAGYYDASGQPFSSTLVYRPANKQFEINP